MCAHEFPEPRSWGSRLEGLFTWLGGGHRSDLGQRHERSTQSVAGALVLLGALLAGLVAVLTGVASTRAPGWAALPVGLVFGVLVAAVTRGTVSGPIRGRGGLAGRAVVAVAVGVVVGELAALALFSGSIDRSLDRRAARTADSTPAVLAASASLDQARSVRAGLDRDVEQARGHLDDALVVARCEYHPTPPCPQTRITGVPGSGAETRTANQLLADAQRELDAALLVRDRQAGDLDARVAQGQRALADARRLAVAEAGRDLGARWVSMNELTLADAGALSLRLLVIAFFVLLYLLPLILLRWRGETAHDRTSAARTERERADFVRVRADLAADTAIAIKQAEVRQAAEIMWAEHQLAQTRLAIEAQAEIDREQQRRRVVEALQDPHDRLSASAGRGFGAAGIDSVADDMYLPIEAQAEAASRRVAELASGSAAGPEVAPNLPAVATPGGAIDNREPRANQVIPSLPDATRAAARWIRPLVPPIIGRALDTGTAPLRSALHVFEEVEEIAFSFKRTRKVTVHDDQADGPAGPTRVEASRAQATDGADGAASGVGARRSSSRGALPKDVGSPVLKPSDRADVGELQRPAGRRELPGRQGPRELPPGN